MYYLYNPSYFLNKFYGEICVISIVIKKVTDTDKILRTKMKLEMISQIENRSVISTKKIQITLKIL